MSTEMLSARQVAQQLQVSPNTVKKWWRDGRLRGVQFSARKLRFLERDIEEFLRLSELPPTENDANYRWEEIAWRHSHRNLLHSLQGQWLVVEGSRLMAHDPDPVVAVQTARRQGVAVPYVFLVNVAEEKSESLGL